MYVLELRSIDGELWARAVGDYFEIAHLVMTVMDAKKFTTDGWELKVKAAAPNDNENIGNFEFIF